MRMKEYNAYMAKRNLILQKLNNLNIEGSILSYLESQGINIEDENISILVRMIRRIVFDFCMYGKDTTIKIMEDNKDYLFNAVTNEDNVSIEQLKSDIYTTLRKNKINEDINNFVLSSASAVNKYFSREQQIDASRYVYAAQ